MRGVPKMDVWAHKDAFEDLQKHLDHTDVAQLRAVCRDWQGVVDSTLSRLAPVNLDCPLLRSRALPGLKSLLLTQLQYLNTLQLQHCSVLTQLTQLHIGGPACSRLKTHHLAWIGKLTNLQELTISKCSKVKLSILSCWHSLTNLQALTLIGLSTNQRPNFHPPNSSNSSNTNSSSNCSVLHAFLSAGAASNLTTLVLGDHQGLSFLSDATLQGLGQLLGPVGKIRVLDLSGCIELTDAGIQQLSNLTSLHQLSLHNCMKIGTGSTQTLTTLTSLKTLNLRGCSQLTDTQLQLVFSSLTRLESLNLQGCSGLVGSCLSPQICKGLVRLKSLNLSYCQVLSIGVFEGLVQLRNLTDLDLTGCNVISGFEALQWLGKMKQLVRIQGSYWRCKAAAGEGLAAAAAAAAPLLPPKLQHLDLSHLTCSEKFLQTLTHHIPKTLTYLNLSNCSGIGPASNPHCLEGLSRLSGLEVLLLSSSVGGVPAHVLQFISVLTGLKDLQLEFVHAAATMSSNACDDQGSSNVVAWLDTFMAYSSSSSGVRAVSDSSSSEATTVGRRQPSVAVQATGVAQLLAAGTCTTAEYACPHQDGSSSSSSSRTPLGQQVHRQLFPGADVAQRHPDVIGPQEQQQQSTQHQQQQQRWLRNLQNLQNLSVTYSPWVTDQILKDLSGLSCLTTLNLVACQNLTGAGFQSWNSSNSMCEDPAAATAVECNSGRALCPTGPNLIGLKLTGCASLTDQGLAAAAAACPMLEDLLLPGCRGLTDHGVQELSTLSRLRTLNLASNKNITARSLQVVIPNLRHLRSLALSLCGGICDDALGSLAAAVDLRSLDLRGCWQITDQGVHDLLCRSSSLLQLNVDSCHRLGHRCWPDTFRPGDPLLPSNDSSSSGNNSSSNGRPGLLIRVATDVSGFSSSSSSKSDQDLSSVLEDEGSSQGTAVCASECTTACAGSSLSPC